MTAKEEFSHPQARVADGIRRLLNESSVQFEEEVVNTGAEIADSFIISTESEIPFTVNFLVLADEFNVLVNGAEFHIYFPEEEPAISEWVTRAINTGAVWASSGTHTGDWAGDAAAAKEKGSAYIFLTPGSKPFSSVA